MTSHTVRSSRAIAALISSGSVCHSRVEPSTSAKSNVTVPVGSSLTPRSLQFNGVSARGSVPLMLASMRRPRAAKHRRKLVDLPPRRAELRLLTAQIYASGPMIQCRRHRILDSFRPEETTMTVHTSRSSVLGRGNAEVEDTVATAQITDVAAQPLAPKNPQELGDHAVVLGASMGGLLAARVLADFFRTVTVVERDVLPDDPANRRGVPQGRHVHSLLARGAQILEELFPGILDELVADGVPVWDGGELSWFHWSYLGHRFVRSGRADVDPKANALYQASRPFLECHVRRRLQD